MGQWEPHVSYLPTVFILGAGASCHSGAPLLKDFLASAMKVMDDLEGKDSLYNTFDDISLISPRTTRWSHCWPAIFRISRTCSVCSTLRRVSVQPPRRRGMPCF